jgi:DNA-directed RNA polymerase specialized sigma24 family protein
MEPSGRRRGAAAFDEFYVTHVDKVYRALAIAVGSDDLAREATDEAMTRAYAHWERVSDLDNPGGWVFRVGLNWATSWWRKTRRERGRLSDVAQPGNPGPDPVALAARAALDRLPVSQRSVVVCRVLLDLSTVETAAVLHLSEGTVKSRLSRGRAALRKALEE